MDTETTFDDILMDELSGRQYNNLAEILGISPKRLGFIKSNPFKWRMEEIRKLAEILVRDPIEIMLDWGLGKEELPIVYLEKAAKEAGLYLNAEIHVAA